jgi:hypothetical protein
MSAFQRFALSVGDDCLDVPCRHCNSRAGEMCQVGGMGGGDAGRPHADRVRAARLVAWWEDFGREDAEERWS